MIRKTSFSNACGITCKKTQRSEFIRADWSDGQFVLRLCLCVHQRWYLLPRQLLLRTRLYGLSTMIRIVEIFSSTHREDTKRG